LAASRCYLQTSKAEGFGIAALEAMAAGLPVAATRVPGLEPLVAGAGLLHESGDAAACAADIRRLCEDEAVRGEAIRAGLVRAQGYSIQGSAAAYGRLYSRVLAESTTSRVRLPCGDSKQQ
ncbi:MAG: glycosyltransferase family 4 protein, partial [Spirochaetaceae bacterium]|nr:glycosyltransferase family 4 protein [Spirochaetaceae bacterium]